MWWKEMLSNGPASQPAGHILWAGYYCQKRRTRSYRIRNDTSEFNWSDKLRPLAARPKGLWQGAMARARLCRQSNTRHATNRYFGQCQSTQSMLVVLALSPWRWWNGERVTSPSITPPYRALLQAGRPLDIVVLP